MSASLAASRAARCKASCPYVPSNRWCAFGETERRLGRQAAAGRKFKVVARALRAAPMGRDGAGHGKPQSALQRFHRYHPLSNGARLFCELAKLSAQISSG